jgi:hypothetical protein
LGKSGRTNGKRYYLPREIFTSSEGKKRESDRKPGNRLTNGVKKSAEGIVGMDTSREKTGGLTKY